MRLNKNLLEAARECRKKYVERVSLRRWLEDERVAFRKEYVEAYFEKHLRERFPLHLPAYYFYRMKRHILRI